MNLLLTALIASLSLPLLAPPARAGDAQPATATSECEASILADAIIARATSTCGVDYKNTELATQIRGNSAACARTLGFSLERIYEVVRRSTASFDKSVSSEGATAVCKGIEADYNKATSSNTPAKPLSAPLPSAAPSAKPVVSAAMADCEALIHAHTTLHQASSLCTGNYLDNPLGNKTRDAAQSCVKELGLNQDVHYRLIQKSVKEFDSQTATVEGAKAECRRYAAGIGVVPPVAKPLSAPLPPVATARKLLPATCSVAGIITSSSGIGSTSAKAASNHPALMGITLQAEANCKTRTLVSSGQGMGKEWRRVFQFPLKEQKLCPNGSSPEEEQFKLLCPAASVKQTGVAPAKPPVTAGPVATANSVAPTLPPVATPQPAAKEENPFTTDNERRQKEGKRYRSSADIGMQTYPPLAPLPPLTEAEKQNHYIVDNRERQERGEIIDFTPHVVLALSIENFFLTYTPIGASWVTSLKRDMDDPTNTPEDRKRAREFYYEAMNTVVNYERSPSYSAANVVSPRPLPKPVVEEGNPLTADTAPRSKETGKAIKDCEDTIRSSAVFEKASKVCNLNDTETILIGLIRAESRACASDLGLSREHVSKIILDKETAFDAGVSANGVKAQCVASMGPSIPADEATPKLDARIADLEKKLAEAEDKAERQRKLDDASRWDAEDAAHRANSRVADLEDEQRLQRQAADESRRKQKWDDLMKPSTPAWVETPSNPGAEMDRFLQNQRLEQASGGGGTNYGYTPSYPYPGRDYDGEERRAREAQHDRFETKKRMDELQYRIESDRYRRDRE